MHLQPMEYLFSHTYSVSKMYEIFMDLPSDIHGYDFTIILLDVDAFNLLKTHPLMGKYTQLFYFMEWVFHWQ